MKILHVIPSLSIATGGPAFNAVSLAWNAIQVGHYAEILTTDFVSSARSVATKRGATYADFPPKTAEIPIHISPVRRPTQFAFAPDMERFLKSRVSDFDVLHVHSVNLYPQMAAWRAARKAGVPIVLSPRGGLDPWVRGKRRWLKGANDVVWQRRMLNGVAALHVTTDDEMTLIEPLGLRVPKIVIPNAFDVDEFAVPQDPQAFRRERLDNLHSPLILNHGRLSEKKGLDILVSALALLVNNHQVHLVLVGADQEGIGDRLRRQAESLRVSEHMTIVPQLSGTELLNAIHSADVWALPSHTENFGMAVAEAMAAARPVVVSPNVNIAAEAAAEDALVMVPNTPEQVASAISDLLRNPLRRSVLGSNGVGFVRRYDWPVVFRQFENLYQSVIEEAGK